MTIAKYKHLSATSHNATRQNSSRFCTTMFILVVVALFFSSNNHANDNNAITPATSGISVPSADEQAAAQVLDQLNQYSSSADWDKYFSLYRQDGIFIGTDANERWGMAEFEHYSRPATI